MGHRLFRSVLAVIILGAPAQATDCNLALVLALDVSGSVDAVEDRLQREGVASAILSPSVRQAFLDRVPVALFAFDWSMPSHQEPLLPGWMMLDSEDDLVEVAEAIRRTARGDEFRLNPPTAVGSALAYAAMALRNGPPCNAMIIDISGDGESNDGMAPSVAYATTPFEGVTVNALVIGGAGASDPFWNDQELVEWFEAEVLRGPGAFAIIADDYGDYGRAMEMKLLRELELSIAKGWDTREKVF